jgi:hypothetical protein
MPYLFQRAYQPLHALHHLRGIGTATATSPALSSSPTLIHKPTPLAAVAGGAVAAVVAVGGQAG